ncbi:MAG: helix-turn-helix domain-containing protein [Treponema sp.]|nr:helix-turn-helix domain-containing protein [Treponema sp.]
MSNQIQTAQAELREMLTIKEVKEVMKIGTNAAYNLIHSKSFPVIKVGHSYRIPKEPFYAWLNQSRTVNF